MSEHLHEQIEVTAVLLGQLQERLNKAIVNGRWEAARAVLHTISQESANVIPTARALSELQHTNQVRKRA